MRGVLRSRFPGLAAIDRCCGPVERPRVRPASASGHLGSCRRDGVAGGSQACRHRQRGADSHDRKKAGHCLILTVNALQSGVHDVLMLRG